MNFDFVLNELSLGKPAGSAHEARDRMYLFVKTLQKLRSATSEMPFAPSLRVNHEFAYAELAPGYNMAQWRDDESVDSVSRGLMKSLAARGPYLRDVPTEVTDEFPIVYRYTVNDEVCIGLGIAHLLRDLAVSLQSEDCWNSSSVRLNAHYLFEAAEESLSVDIPHASDPSHVQASAEFISRRIGEYLLPIETLSDLWIHRERLFPHLAFIDEVETQLSQLDVRQHLAGVWSSLRAYDDYAARWAQTKEKFAHKEMPNVTPESAGRIKMYGHLMTFAWKGQNRNFYFHGRFTPDAGRIHMWPDIANRGLVIGYIGMKIGL